MIYNSKITHRRQSKLPADPILCRTIQTEREVEDIPNLDGNAHTEAVKRLNS